MDDFERQAARERIAADLMPLARYMEQFAPAKKDRIRLGWDDPFSRWFGDEKAQGLVKVWSVKQNCYILGMPKKLEGGKGMEKKRRGTKPEKKRKEEVRVVAGEDQLGVSVPLPLDAKVGRVTLIK